MLPGGALGADGNELEERLTTRRLRVGGDTTFAFRLESTIQ